MDFASFFNAVKPAYEIEQSLRFNSSDSTNLSRTPGSTGNRKTFTVSCWVKRGKIGTTQMIWSAGPASGGNIYLYFTSSDELQLSVDTEASGIVKTTQKFRDPSAWYHIVCAVDTSQATAANRVKFFINGTAVSDFASSTYPSQNHDTHWNHTSAHRIGQRNDGTAYYLNAYIAEFYNLDGTAVSDAEDFAEADDNGVWRPIETSGLTFGTNGTYLKFDETATNGIGHDHSGNGNNWTATGFTTSGPGTDVFSDTPTKNWCTMNPLNNGTGDTENGSLEHSRGTGDSNSATFGTIGVTSGKWYWEAELYSTSGGQYSIGIGMGNDDLVVGESTKCLVYSSYQGQKVGGGSYQSYGSSYGVNDIIGVKVDLDAGNIEFSKNGTSQGTAFTSIDTSKPWFPISWKNDSNVAQSFRWNLGQREFAYPPGTSSATEYFNTVTYTGNGGTQSITGVGFQPDLIWIKLTNAASSHSWYDVIRGATKVIGSNSTDKETTDGSVTPTSDGFDLSGENSSFGSTNGNSYNYVAWCWKAGGTASANNTGTINANVSANQDAGFSVVTYSGGGSAGTVAHGLSSAPKVYFVKNRSSSTAYNWYVYTETTGAGHFLKLNANSAKTASNDPFNNTAPTSSVFSVGGENVVNGVDYVAYCFAEKTGVNKFGSYSGTGSTQFIECGFKPALVIMKSSANAREWIMKDTARGDDKTLETHETNSESQSETVGYQSNPNGFTLVGNSVVNTSGDTIIFMAFAENFTADNSYKSLNTANLPAPTVKDGSKHFDTETWDGSGSSNARTLEFEPSFLWIKARGTNNNSHYLYDQIRGNTKYLNSDAVGAEGTESGGQLASFDSSGFTVATNDSHINKSGNTYVAWAWKGNGSGSSNTDGTITSTVSANPTAGFSIVSYTGTGANGTVGHGLGVAPSVVLVKNRDDGTKGWPVQHTALGNNYMEINNSSGPFTGSSYFQNTAPTSTVFSVGTIGSTNGSGDKMIAYCFAEVEGYSKLGSYTGNGSTDGPFIATSFAPAMIIIKKNGSANWVLMDKERYDYNPRTQVIYPNDTSPEVSLSGVADIDFLSNGFKIRRSWDNINASGTTYVFIALAENPFGGKGAAPTTAR